MSFSEKTLRENAIAWWGNLSHQSQWEHFFEYKQVVFTPASKPDGLTGREIQNIWAVKTTPETIKDEDKEIEELEKDLWTRPTGTPPIKEQSNSVSISLEDAALKILADELDKYGLRNYTCANLFGYSQLERNIVNGILDIQKEQYKELLSSYGELIDRLEKMCVWHENQSTWDKGDNGYYDGKRTLTKAAILFEQFNQQ